MPGQHLTIAGLHGQTAAVVAEQARNLAVRIADKKRRPADRGYAIELARYDEAFELGSKRHQVNIGDRQAL